MSKIQARGGLRLLARLFHKDREKLRPTVWAIAKLYLKPNIQEGHSLSRGHRKKFLFSINILIVLSGTIAIPEKNSVDYQLKLVYSLLCHG